MNVIDCVDFQDWQIEDFNLTHESFYASIPNLTSMLLELPALPIASNHYYNEGNMMLSALSTDETEEEELWSEQEDEALHKLAGRYRCEWGKVSVFFEGKSERVLQKRWNKIKDQYKDVWTKTEDRRLMQLREKFGRDFKALSSYFPQKPIKKIKQRYAQLLKQKETQAILSLSPYKIPIDETHIEEIYDSFFAGSSCREEDSTSTGTPEDTLSSGQASPEYISDDDLKIKTHIDLETSEKRETLQQLYRRMFDLEKILRDTNSHIIKLAESIEARKLNCKISI